MTSTNTQSGTSSSPTGEHLSGLIERITFHSEDSGFCVLQVKAKGYHDLVTVVGVLPEIRAGEWIEADGKWVISRDYGQQFKADMIHTIVPTTVEGIEKYLASGLIKGIGPAYAHRMVKHFGLQVLDVIEKQPERLREVDGIGPARQEKIKAAWAEQRAVREIMIFLHGHGVGTSRAFRIYKTYGQDSIQKVTQDPYCLARDIRGIGFKTADKIAESLGIGKESDLRARAGVEYVLQELTDEGHCGYSRDELIKAAIKVLEIPESIVQSAIEYELKQDRIVQHERKDQSPLIFLTGLDQAEKQLATSLISLLKGRHPCPTIDVEKAIAWVEGKVGLQLASQQREAIRLAVTNKVLVITGGPGVGKTTLVNSLVKVFRAKKMEVILAAPTGRAARRMSDVTGLTAKTIHRLLEFDPNTQGFKHNTDNPLEGDIFVIDETSMVDVVLAYQLVRAIPLSTSLILVGDVDQLPSVGPGNVLRDLIDSGVVPVCRLTEVFRQAAASAIVANAHRVNQGQMPVFPKKKVVSPNDTDFYFIQTDEPEKAVELIQRLVCKAIPERFGFDRFEDIQVLTPMQRGILGSRNLNTTLQASLNPSGPFVERFGWIFRVGDKVMQMVNDYDKDVFNGDIGRIVSLNEEDQEVSVRFDNRQVIYDFNELDELVLAYSATVHKSQGSEYPAVVLAVHTQHYNLLQRNLLYTAITRSRKLVVLVGSYKAMAIAVKRTESRGRVTLLKDRLQQIKRIE